MKFLPAILVGAVIGETVSPRCVTPRSGEEWRAVEEMQPVIFLLVRALLSAVIIVAVTEIAKRNASVGALLASLPLVVTLSMVWLWYDTGDPIRLASYTQATFWYVLPSLPMFLLIPAMLRAGLSFWLSLAAGIAITAGLYLLMRTLLARFGLAL